MKPLKVVKTVYLNAPRAHVWRFLTEADMLALWFHRAAVDFAEGGDYTLVSNSLGREGEPLLTGKILEMRPPERLVHTFNHKTLGGVETKCTWTLEEAREGTLLTLVHEGFEKVAADYFGVVPEIDKGWDLHLSRLRVVTK